MVEVAKALSYNAKLIIMDEPTSSLTDTETATLMDIIRRLRSEGVAIVYISHRMNEIFEISDEIAVMRDGEMLDKVLTSQTNESEIIAAMVGRDVKNLFVKEPAPIGDTVLEVKGLSTKNFLKDISFTVRAGEIVGFAGLVGAGRSEVMRAVFGHRPARVGRYLCARRKGFHPQYGGRAQMRHGLRARGPQGTGADSEMSVEENTSLAALRSVSKNWFIRPAQEKALAEEYVQKLKVKTPSLAQKVLNLSGGNQQKVVIAKWMATHPHHPHSRRAYARHRRRREKGDSRVDVANGPGGRGDHHDLLGVARGAGYVRSHLRHA